MDAALWDNHMFCPNSHQT